MRAAWWWIDRWRKSTAYTDMTLAEQGAYRNLLDELWLRNGVLPNSERILAKVAGDVNEWPSVRTAVLARFRLTTSGWRHDTHDEIAIYSHKQAEKGRARAAAAERENGRFLPNSPAEHQPTAGNGLAGVRPAESQPPSPSPSLTNTGISISSVIPINGTHQHAPTAQFSLKRLRKMRFTKREISEAKRARANTMQPCQHEPRCADFDACVLIWAFQMRQTRRRA